MIRPYEHLLLSALAALAMLAWFTPYAAGIVPLHLALAAAIMQVSRIPPGSRWYLVRQIFSPAVVLPLSFVESELLVPWIHGIEDGWYDATLAAADSYLLGDVEPIIAAAPPWLADLTMVGYVSYFLLPVFIGVLTYRSPAAFYESVTVLTVAFLASFAGYFLLPALGPHVMVPTSRPPNLDGLVFAGPAHAIFASLQGHRPDAFPSGHTIVSLSLLALYYRHARPWFWGWLPFVLLLITGAWLHRYHYLVDILAGVLIAPGAVWMGLRAARPASSKLPARLAPSRPMPHDVAWRHSSPTD